MALFQYPLPPRVQSLQPYAHSGLSLPQPLIPIRVIGPRGRRSTNVDFDSGAVCCLFPEWFAWRIGILQTPKSPVVLMGSGVSQTGWHAWFERIELMIEDPAGVIPPFRWSATVGFTPAGSFRLGSAGILGINGGFDAFQRVEFDWANLARPEVTIRT